MVEEAIDILLIEDDPDDAVLLRDTLSEAEEQWIPYTLRCADSLSSGAEQIREKAPDIILLDLNLPTAAACKPWRASSG